MPTPMRRTLTLQADPGFALPELDGEALEGRLFEVTYFDTPDSRLAAADVTLRRHVEKGRSRWFLELRGGEERLEADGGPVPPVEVTRPLATLLAASELRPVVTLRTRQAGRMVRDNGHAVARLLADDVSILEPRRDGFAQVRIELVEGRKRDLTTLRETVRRAGARKDAVSVERSLGLVEEAPKAGASDDAREIVGLALRRQQRALLRHDPGARLGFAEDVHQLRVAARRSRAYLRAARRLFHPAWTSAVEADLRWLGQEVGAVRDLDVLIERLELERGAFDEGDARAAAPLLKRLRGERSRARERLLAALDSERYAVLLEALEDGPPSWKASTGDPNPRKLAKREVERLGGDEIDEDASDEDLHALRIRAKRLRYAAELAAPGNSRARRLVKRAKRLQDVLGEHQDAAVAERRLRGLVRPRDTAATALVAGRLVERQRERRRAAREAFPSVLRKLERAGSKL
jgi:CHAD domain-containing protein